MNAGLIAALGFAGQFEGAGARGEALAGVEREQADSLMQANSGFADVSSMMSQIATLPTVENAMLMAQQYQQMANANNKQAPQWNPNAMSGIYQNWQGIGPNVPTPSGSPPTPWGGGGSGYHAWNG